jgi:putative membrane protein
MSWYQLVKALHLIGVIAWLAGMFYLPRLYAYHADAKPGSDKSETFKIMERRLLRAIINPAMIMTWVFGLVLLFVYPIEAGIDWSRGWVWVKAIAVIALTSLHGLYSRWRRDFAADRNRRPARFYKIWNEVPTVLMIIIVIMVIGKPF